MAASTVQKNLKPYIAEKWEIDAIGKFLFEEYQNLLFGLRTDWLVEKHNLRLQFRKFLDNDKNGLRERLFEANGTCCIGTLLRRCNYLVCTVEDSNFYHIQNISLYKYIKRRCIELDEKQKNGISTDFMSDDTEITTHGYGDPAITGSLRVDEDAPTYELVYKGSQQQERLSLFGLTNMGCYICQVNFTSPDDFENHVETHGYESDFEILQNYDKYTTPIFQLSYNVCKDSHYFRFNLLALRPNIIIEKLVMLQTRTFYYVNNTRVPYELGEDRKDYFFADSHLFRRGIAQPIIVVFHEKSNKDKRIVEQHHFCRLEEFPIVKLNFNPCRLSNKNQFNPIFSLPYYMSPDEIRSALRTDAIEEPLSELSDDFRDYLVNNKTLTIQNAQGALLKLLQIEDWDVMREYSSLVQCNVNIRSYKNDYILKLKTPKQIRIDNIVYPFDDVIIIASNEATAIPISLEGFVNKMEHRIDTLSKRKKSEMFYGLIEGASNDEVTFKCKKKIPLGKKYTAIFRPSRMGLRYQYRALEQLSAMRPSLLQRFLFPDVILPRQLSVVNLELLNKTIYKNPEQYQAIQCVVDSVGKQSAPYIIFGPPGTGKTTTLVEAIYQLYIRQPQSRILITAGSNGACDEIALRLCNAFGSNIKLHTITRIYARSYEDRVENISDVLLEHSNLYGPHFLPGVCVLHTYRIVVCTLSMVGRLATGNFGRDKSGKGVFTHIFVDEVAASTEAETLVGLMATLSSKANLIISGDHRQLGPILNSKRAAAMGLEVSLMERLLKRECYRVDEDGNYNRQIQTRLCRNFRSHHEIVNLYGDMYYDGQLKAEADPSDVQKLCRDWYRSPNAAYPIIFHSTFGPEQRGKNSTSCYNPLEVAAVMDYVCELLYFGIKGNKIEQSDIGIITPYKQQNICIQKELNLRNWYQIETGVAETFQGKEKTIIIVSFVRSFTNSLGFVNSPRRLNVILSRARSLLILIGNPRTLSLNDDFKNIIEKCKAHKTLVGAKYFDDDGINPKKAGKKGKQLNEQMQKLNKSMTKLSISKPNMAQINNNNASVDNQSKKSKNTNRRYGKKKKEQKKTHENEEDASSGNDTLKTPNSSTFKSAEPQSTEKQRRTFERNKNLYLTEELHKTDGVRNTTNRKESDIDELFLALPRVPRNKTQPTKAKDQGFKIFDLPKNHNSMHDELLHRLSHLRMTQQTQNPQDSKTSIGVNRNQGANLNERSRSGGTGLAGNLQGTNSTNNGPSVSTANTSAFGLPTNTRPSASITNRDSMCTSDSNSSIGASFTSTGRLPLRNVSESSTTPVRKEYYMPCRYSTKAKENKSSKCVIMQKNNVCT